MTVGRRAAWAPFEFIPRECGLFRVLNVLNLFLQRCDFLLQSGNLRRIVGLFFRSGELLLQTRQFFLKRIDLFLVFLVQRHQSGFVTGDGPRSYAPYALRGAVS